MSKKSVKTDYHIAVYPANIKNKIACCEQIIEQIKRHVDDVGEISIRTKSSFVCSCCGEKWIAEGDEYNGGCCETDRQLEENRNKIKQTVANLEEKMQCNCDLDNWVPEKDTGHSHVCRIHQAAMNKFAEWGS